jgi:hypothetical protein
MKKSRHSENGQTLFRFVIQAIVTPILRYRVSRFSDGPRYGRGHGGHQCRACKKLSSNCSTTNGEMVQLSVFPQFIPLIKLKLAN